VDDVVAAAVAEQMAQHTQPEDERRPDPAATAGVELEPRPHRDHPDAVEGRIHAGPPLPERQVGDVVAVLGELLREVAVPAFCAADRVGIEAVVDDADPH
jgi:hypothetical protein